jgi:hypothetical protein
MDKPAANRWSGKSAEDVLAESFHEIRNPIFRLTGYLQVLKSAEISDEQTRYMIEAALNCSLTARDVVESVYRYLNE